MVWLATALWRKNERSDAILVLFAAAAFSSQRYLCPWYWLPIVPWALLPSRRVRAGADPARMSAIGAFARVAVTVVLYVASNIERWT